MDLLKFIIASNNFPNPCFLCFKDDKNNLNIHTVFEIHYDCDIISLSLADMFKHLFPGGDYIFMHACNDCSDLISELYIRIQNRKSRLWLLNCIVEQLVVKTDDICGITLTNNKLVLNVELPSYPILNDLFIHNNDKIQHSMLNYATNEEQCYESTNVDRDHQVVETCQYCSETFLRKDELRSHLRIHTQKRQRKRTYHYCNDCTYKTLSKTTLQAHINKNHLNTRPHVCQVCYKRFYNKSNLNEHIKTHSSQRNQVCELCGGSFIHKKSLIEHLRLHSDIRPYKCDICHKGFVTSGRRSDHIKRSHMEKTECCLICNKKYSMKKELARHMNNVHLRGM